MGINPYPWIPTGPVRRVLRVSRPTQGTMSACARCGWEWRGRRKMCPACLVRQERTDAA